MIGCTDWTSFFFWGGGGFEGKGRGKEREMIGEEGEVVRDGERWREMIENDEGR